MVAGIALVMAAGCGPAVPEVAVVQPAPPGGEPTERVLSEENLAALVLAANNAMIERAQVARERASFPQVRSFAERILREQQAAGQVMRQQLERLEITPEPEATAMQLESNANKTVAMMRSTSGPQVDRIYLDAEIADHRWLIQTLDTLIPATPDSDMREGMTKLQSALNARLQEAEQLRMMVMQQGK